MARVQNPIIGQAVNQAGGMIFSNWKTLKVMRSKPLAVANPNTTGQQGQRNRMALFASLFREILQTIRIGFVRYQAGTTQWAQFLKDNLMTATSLSGTTASLIPSNVSVSKGSLLLVEDLAVDNETGDQVTFTWIDNSGQPGANATDRFYVVFLNNAGNAIGSATSTATRADGTAVVTRPSGIASTTWIAKCFFANVAGDDVSDSQQAA